MIRGYKPSVFHYKKKYLKPDIIAALVVTAIAIPQSLGFAVIVGLPPVTGLYTALLAPIVFGLLASTRRLVVGADSATAALIASGAVLVAQAGTAEYANAVALIGLLTAGILLLMAAFRMGFLSDLISRPVLVGFLAGVGYRKVITIKKPSPSVKDSIKEILDDKKEIEEKVSTVKTLWGIIMYSEKLKKGGV